MDASSFNIKVREMNFKLKEKEKSRFFYLNFLNLFLNYNRKLSVTFLLLLLLLNSHPKFTDTCFFRSDNDNYVILVKEKQELTGFCVFFCLTVTALTR